MLADFIFHHIGIAVYDIDKTAKYYIDAGYSKTETIEDKVQNIRLCFLVKDKMPKIELLAPIDTKSPVVRILDQVGVSPYHTCYEVKNIEDAIRRLKKIRFVPIIKPVVACALDNNEICFLYNKDVGLIELIEIE